MSRSTNVFFIYETEQVPLLLARMRAGLQTSVIALDYEAELDLKKAKIPFTSMQDLARTPEEDREPMELGRCLGLEWYVHPEMGFFKHDNILLGEQHEGSFFYYVQTLLYYLIVVDQILDHVPDARRIYVPTYSHLLPNDDDPIGAFKHHALADVAHLLAVQRGIQCEVVPIADFGDGRGAFGELQGRIVEMLTHLLTGISNVFITVLRKRRSIRLFSTDSWSRISPVIMHLRDVELVMTRRSEMKAMKWSIWRTRARFHHRFDFVDQRMREQARERAQAMVKQWEALGTNPAISELFVYRGISFWPIVRKAIDHLVRHNSEYAMLTIENTKQIFLHYDINRVQLFASTKGYNELIARVAEGMNIPSIELQHAIEQVEPTNPHARLNARYLAAYGSLTKKHYERFGVESWRVVACGSPRFDAHHSPVPEEKATSFKHASTFSADALKALVVMPAVYLSLEFGHFTSYAVRKILEDLAAVQKKDAHLAYILKLRGWGVRERFYRRKETRDLFSAHTVIAQYEDIRMLFGLSDVVISGSSTVVIEAMIARKPVLMYVPRTINENFKEYVDAGAVLLARTQEDLARQVEFLKVARNRELLVERADVFLRDNFSFDGRSSERVAALIRRAARSDVSEMVSRDTMADI